MLVLTRAAYAQARHFLQTEARPLERTLLKQRFEAGPASAVVAEMTRFQNEDGGFGRALEPDLRTPSSSALATADALLLLHELGIPADHPVVTRAVHYLLSTFDPFTHVWRVAPPDTNDHPHAPWWHDDGGSLARIFDGFLVIPRARIVSALTHYAALVPADWLEGLVGRTVADIETLPTLGSGGGDTLRYAIDLAETETLPVPYRQRLAARVRAVVPGAVSTDPAQWGTYVIVPLKLAPTPKSLAADLIAEAVQAHLDYLIQHQTTEGTWEPTWTWSGNYPDDWEQARGEWRGVLTLDALTSLRAYGRIDAG